MRFGIREICDVVLRAKSAQKIGDKVFYKNEPVLYFDSLKTSSLESQATTVYAQGGRGNARLIAWEGERTVTFTMEDALLSPESFAILSGAGIIKANEKKSIIVHKSEKTNDVVIDELNECINIKIKEQPYLGKNRRKNSQDEYQEDPIEDFIYIMLLNDKGEIISEPYIAAETDLDIEFVQGKWQLTIEKQESAHFASDSDYNINPNHFDYIRQNDIDKFYNGCTVLVDYYVEKKNNDAYQINITPDKFGGNFYLEASTLFRTESGVDLPAEFIIPNCKIQSNFTFTMSSSGDPTTFTFTMDAFPDYTRWDQTKKVFATIQVIQEDEIISNFKRLGTPHDYKSDIDWQPYMRYNNEQAQYLEEEPPAKVINMIFDSIGSEGNIFANCGYLKGCAMQGGQHSPDIVDNPPVDTTKYTVTGFIPYLFNQKINIAGFLNEERPQDHLYQGIYFYNKDFDYKGKENFNNNLENAYEPEFENIEVAKEIAYIRICFYNTNIKDMAVIVYGEPYQEE